MATKNLSGGDRLKATLARLSKQVKTAALLKVGFQNGARYSEQDGGQSIAYVAIINEFGAPSRGQPPRPFFRNMIAKNENGWGDNLAKYLTKNDYDAKLAFNKLGEEMIGELQDSIIATNEPKLSPITVMLRHMRSENPDLIVTGKTVGEAAKRVKEGKTTGGASIKPLVYTGDMLRAITKETE
jgi:hypothetical protein